MSTIANMHCGHTRYSRCMKAYNGSLVADERTSTLFRCEQIVKSKGETEDFYGCLNKFIALGCLGIIVLPCLLIAMVLLLYFSRELWRVNPLIAITAIVVTVIATVLVIRSIVIKYGDKRSKWR
jgi:hypothetical protein